MIENLVIASPIGAKVEHTHVAPARILQERRRPGRSELVSPALIELLRLRPNVEALPSADRPTGDAIAAARGIMLGAALGLPIWAGLIWLVAVVLH